MRGRRKAMKGAGLGSYLGGTEQQLHEDLDLGHVAAVAMIDHMHGTWLRQKIREDGEQAAGRKIVVQQDPRLHDDAQAAHSCPAQRLPVVRQKATAACGVIATAVRPSTACQPPVLRQCVNPRHSWRRGSAAVRGVPARARYAGAAQMIIS